MIRDAEIRRLARMAGVEPRIMELDYALGWALRGIADHPDLARRLVFKGGTCLRKCYFGDYRFSEDLDFTATQWFGWEELEKAVTEAFAEAQKASGIDFGARSPRLRIIDDEYGRESLRFTAYWRGPHATGGTAPGLRLGIPGLFPARLRIPKSMLVRGPSSQRNLAYQADWRCSSTSRRS